MPIKADRVSGVGTDQLRRHNLSAILTLLHHDGSQPRSALTAQTGLNRSTVAALVGELTELGLVHETEPDPTRQVGRPSPTVNADRRNIALAINPEVDAVTAGVVALGGEVVTTLRRETDHAPTAVEAVAISADLIRELTAGLGADIRVVGVGVAVPGLVRAADGLVRLAPHLQWGGRADRRDARRRHRLPGGGRQRRPARGARRAHLRFRSRGRRSRLPQRRTERHRRRGHRGRRAARRRERLRRRIRPHPRGRRRRRRPRIAGAAIGSARRRRAQRGDPGRTGRTRAANRTIPRCSRSCTASSRRSRPRWGTRSTS